MNKNILFKIILEIMIILFIITFVLEFLILFRPFYYFNISFMRMPQATGYKYEDIKQGFDELMDFLVWHKEFKMGIFKCTENAKMHFYDCQKLFTLNFIVLIISAISILIIFLLQKKKIINITYHHFYIGMSSVFTFIIIGVISIIWALINFYSFFVFLHAIFFPGKTNFFFTNEDTIINILPTELWMNYGLLLLTLLIICNLIIIIIYIKQKKELD